MGIIRWEQHFTFSRRLGRPGSRWGHSLNFVKETGLLFLFGGYGQEEGLTSSVHVYNVAKKSWSKPAVSGTLPPSRDSHTCTTVGSKLFVFGGTDGSRRLHDLYVFDTVTYSWSSPKTQGETPPLRDGHGACLIGDYLYVFGGSESRDVFYNDLYALHVETFTWTKIATSGTPPSPRERHSFVPYNKTSIIVFGGQDVDRHYLRDLHKLDTETMTWEPIRAWGWPLSHRGGHGAWIMEDYLVVFGGCYSSPSNSCNALSDVQMLNLSSKTWKQPELIGISPTPRFAHCGDVIDVNAEKGKIVIFGGCNQGLEAQSETLFLHVDFTPKVTLPPAVFIPSFVPQRIEEAQFKLSTSGSTEPVKDDKRQAILTGTPPPAAPRRPRGRPRKNPGVANVVPGDPRVTVPASVPVPSTVPGVPNVTVPPDVPNVRVPSVPVQPGVARVTVPSPVQPGVARVTVASPVQPGVASVPVPPGVASVPSPVQPGVASVPVPPGVASVPVPSVASVPVPPGVASVPVPSVASVPVPPGVAPVRRPRGRPRKIQPLEGCVQSPTQAAVQGVHANKRMKVAVPASTARPPMPAPLTSSVAQAYKAKKAVPQKVFEGKLTQVFHYGYNMETSIEGQAFRGLLFSYKPGFTEGVHAHFNREMEAEATNVDGVMQQTFQGEACRFDEVQAHKVEQIQPENSLKRSRVDEVQVGSRAEETYDTEIQLGFIRNKDLNTMEDNDLTTPHVIPVQVLEEKRAEAFRRTELSIERMNKVEAFEQFVNKLKSGD